MIIKNYYEILGVSYDADSTTIRSAYRELAKKYHPDKSKNKDDTKFKEIVEAYEILKNDSTKKDYDRIYNLYFRNYTYTAYPTYPTYTTSHLIIKIALYVLLIIFLIIFIDIIKNIIYSTNKTKTHLKHNSLSKSSYKK